MTCKPCRVTFEGSRYQIASEGKVYPCDRVTHQLSAPVSITLACLIRNEASRQRRNRNARERNEAMRDLGMVKTAYGWE